MREAARAEIKAAALAELNAGGVEAVSFSAIGRVVGMTPQALYRYFDDREALLAELAADGYRDLAKGLWSAVDTGGDADERLRRLAHAYRRWALANPRLYALIFSSPAGADERLASAAHGAMAAVFRALEGTQGRTLRGARVADLERQLDRWARHRESSTVTANLARSGIAVVSRLHGLVDLELRGQLKSMRIDGALLLDDEIEALIDGA
jgi:AcrR family transcriptional regulator